MRVICTALVAALCIRCAHADTPVFAMSSGFSSDMVLQRAPAKAAVYGSVPANATVSVSVSGPSEYKVEADIVSEGAFKAFLQPAAAGGVYTITVACTSGCDGAEDIVLERVTFGDVFFCGGQSNMALSLHYTFEAEAKTAEVLQGKYSNIRFFQYGTMNGAYKEDVPQYTTTTGAHTWYNTTYAAGLPDGGAYNPFHTFSATCMHFGMSLTDLAGEGVPVGLIQSAIGGTRIEQWVDNSTYAQCQNSTGTGTKLYYGMVTPFVNTTIAGWLWYQGENNCVGVPGNSLTGVGYGCYQAELVSLWRRIWSESSGTTSPEAPFGLVTLAAGGSEGHGTHMAHMRWAQTANHGVLPNPAMPNTFLAQGFDLGDPWANGNSGTQNCSHVDPDTGAYGPNCLQWDASQWVEALQPMYPFVRNNTAPFYMGPIHPRIKHPVGRRLATAYSNLVGGSGPYTGPTLDGCSVSGNSLEVRFNTTLLRGDKVLLQDFNTTGWTDSNAMLVCTGAHPLANATTCACNGWGYVRCNTSSTPPCDGHGDTFWYCEEGPGYKPPVSRAPEAEVATPPLQWRPSTNPFLAIWQPAPLQLTGSNSVSVDLTQVNATGGVMALRYGWGFDDDVCCPDPRVGQGYLPCQPGACPIMTQSTNLPANPFFANIVGGRCECLPPQVCSN